MTKSTITREQAEEAIDGLEGLISRGVQSVYLDVAIAGLRQLLFAMDQKPALHRYRRKSVEPYGPYPWHYEEFVDLSRPLEGIEDEYYYAAPPAVSGFAVDGEPAENHIGSKNALDAIVSFIKSKSNPTVKCYEEVSEQLFKDNCHGIHSHVIEYILKLGEELEDLRAEQDEVQPAPVVPDAYVRDERGRMMLNGICEPKIGFGAGWNACRAAMLQAGSSPAQSDCCPAQNHASPEQNGDTPAQSQGWIPVSERMPEDEQEVLTINRMGHRFVSFFDKHSGLFFDRLDAPAACCIEHVLVTHWMPLPATPQEVKGE